METIVSSVIAAAVTLLVCVINNSQQAARTRNLLDYKLEQLTKRVDKHNNVIERTYEWGFPPSISNWRNVQMYKKNRLRP